MENLQRHMLSFQISKTHATSNWQNSPTKRRQYTSGYKHAKKKKQAKLMSSYERKEAWNWHSITLIIFCVQSWTPSPPRERES